MPEPVWYTDPEIVDRIIAGLIAVFSALSTLVVTHLLRNSGRIRVFVRTFESQFTKSDGEGGQEPVTSIQKSELAFIQFEIDFWNPSDSPKSIRDLKVEIKNKNQKISLPLIVQVNTAGSAWANLPYSMNHKDLNVVNLPSKQISPLRFSIRIPPEQNDLFHGTVDFLLVGKHPTWNFLFKSRLDKRVY